MIGVHDSTCGWFLRILNYLNYLIFVLFDFTERISYLNENVVV